MGVSPVTAASRFTGDEVVNKGRGGQDESMGHSIEIVWRRLALGTLPFEDPPRKLSHLPVIKQQQSSQGTHHVFCACRPSRVLIGFIFATARPDHCAATEYGYEHMCEAGAKPVNHRALFVDLFDMRQPAQVHPIQGMAETSVSAREMTKLVGDDGARFILVKDRQQRNSERHEAAIAEQAKHAAHLAGPRLKLVA